MKCLLCTETIGTSTAVYTTPCHHVFCLKCFDDKFRDELVCPLCDTVLPKDGTQKINLRPNDDDVQKACHGAISKAGMEPQQLCAVLESGLEFWAAQQRNEASIHKASLENLKEELEQVKKLNRNLSMSLESEKCKTQTALDEKEELIEQFEELEKCFEEKAKAHRKLNESYKTLLKSIQDATRVNMRESQLLSIANRDEHSQYEDVAVEQDEDTKPRTRREENTIQQVDDEDDADNPREIHFSQRNSNFDDKDSSYVHHRMFEIRNNKRNKATRKGGGRERRGHRVDENA